MAVYSQSTAGVMTQREVNLYGSTMLGTEARNVNVDAAFSPYVSQTSSFAQRGMKQYFLTNHLGNTLVTLSDKRLASAITNGTVTAWKPDVVSATDYSSFGVGLLGRQFNGSSIEYGFNSKWNEVETGYQNYGMRDYDARARRFNSVDPLTGKYSDLTPYQFASNRPIDGVDLDGLEYSPAGQSLNGPRDATSVRMYSLPPEIQKNVSYSATQQLAQAKALQAMQNAPVFRADNRSSQQIQADQQRASYNQAMQKMYNSDEGSSFQIFSGIGAAAIGASPELGTAYGVGHGVATDNKTEVATSLLTYGMYKGSSIFLNSSKSLTTTAAGYYLASAADITATEKFTLKSINKIGGNLNCVNCTIATDSYLKGMPASQITQCYAGVAKH